jgi:hypothetical protein
VSDHNPFNRLDTPRWARWALLACIFVAGGAAFGLFIRALVMAMH